MHYEQATEVVTKVIDGDTFETKSYIVRLEGTDAPEKRQLGAAEATNALKNLILGKPVDIVIKIRDQYGRAVAQVWVNDRSVNDIMKRYNK